MPSLLLLVWPTCVPTRALERARCCVARQQSKSSICRQSVFRTVILERLRLPFGHNELQVRVRWVRGTWAVTVLHAPGQGDSGPGQSFRRGHLPVCREAGAECYDTGEIDVLAAGLPMHHGAQLAVDITLRSAVNASGEACANACCTEHGGTRRSSTPSCLKGICVALWSF